MICFRAKTDQEVKEKGTCGSHLKKIKNKKIKQIKIKFVSDRDSEARDIFFYFLFFFSHFSL